MDSSREEKNNFSMMASVLRIPESEITEQGLLSMDIIEKVRKWSWDISKSYRLG